MSWVDIKYANMVGARLVRFKIVRNSPYVANYRCPLCDDIKETKRARGYLLEKNGRVMSYCHNCGASMSLYHFLETIDHFLSQEYKLETLKDRWVSKTANPEIKMLPPKFKKNIGINLGVALSSKISNRAKTYVKDRKIPEKFYGSLYYAESLSQITRNIEQYKGSSISSDPALIIPFFDKDRQFSYICCRAILPSSTFRYLVLEVGDAHPKIWGLEFINWNEPIFIFEGPIDAMCVKNSLAMGGVSSGQSLDYVLSCTKKENLCFVYDKDMIYNNEVKRQVKKRIAQKFKVVIYNKSFPGKDINMVLQSGKMTQDEILDYLQSRTYSGLRAEIELSHQSKHLFS